MNFLALFSLQRFLLYLSGATQNRRLSVQKAGLDMLTPSTYPPTTSQSVSLSLLVHRRPVLGVFILRLSCDLKRRTPPLGERVHTLPQPGHFTRAIPLSSKRWREMGTTPENVHVFDAATKETLSELATKRLSDYGARFEAGNPS